MKNGYLKYFAILLTLVICSCSSLQNKQSVSFFDRKVDLTPYFTGFPYTGFLVSLDAKKVFYFHDDGKKILKMIDIEQAKKGQFNQGEALSNIDFDKRTFWSPSYNKKDNSLYWVGDEDNTEVTNLYRMNLDTRRIGVITKVSYIYGYQYNKDKTKMAYISRLSDGVDAKGEVHVIDLKTLETRVVGKDGGKLRYYWGTPSWSEDEKHLVVTAILNKDRNKRQLVLYNTETKKEKILTDRKKPRVALNLVKNWVSPTEFLFASDESGVRDIYQMNIKTGRQQRITRLKMDGTSVKFHEGSLIFISRDPIQSQIVVYQKDKQSKSFTKRYQKTWRGQFSIVDMNDSGDLVVQQSAFNKKVFYAKTNIDLKKIGEFETLVTMKANLLDQLVATEKIEDLTYETFDVDPKTGQKRKIRALLYHPKNPLTGNRKMAMIQSFYGYWNSYRDDIQILQKAGVYVLTPAPRGAGGLGRDFASLNDKDLGGNEIVDIIYGGKFLEKKLNIKSQRVGVFGRSHGGYATMRLLTFPGQVNGNKADYPWGFGIASAGFSDITHFYKHTNIPTWVIKEAGNPKTEAAKLRARSPLHNAQHFRGKLLIIHGGNDRRVPVEGSRQMTEALKKVAPDRVTYVEWPGQGHSVKGLENNIKKYTQWFKFLESTVE